MPAATPVKATTRLGVLASSIFWLRSSVNDQGPVEPLALVEPGLSSWPQPTRRVARVAPPAASKPRRESPRADMEAGMMTSFDQDRTAMIRDGGVRLT